MEEIGIASKKPLRLTYLFTRSYRLGYRHFKLSLTAQVHPDDEARQLLKDSFKRAKAQIAAGREPRANY